VMEEDLTESDLNPGVLDDLLHLAGDVIGTPAASGNGELLLMDHCEPFSPLPLSPPEEREARAGGGEGPALRWIRESWW
jgi:hypothetical protein